MTQLLVSVRSAREAEIALAGGADIIDVKEPARGSLGAADAAVMSEVVAHVDGRKPVSAALGEWNELRVIPRVAGLTWCKVGLAGLRSDSAVEGVDWRAGLRVRVGNARTVAVTYADWRTCGAPDPDAVAEAAAAQACPAVLVDTHDKRRGNLLDLWTAAELRSYIEQVRGRGMLIAVAGSLTFSALEDVLSLSPDIVAVRGAVCGGDRGGDVSQRLVQAWSDAVHGTVSRGTIARGAEPVSRGDAGCPATA